MDEERLTNVERALADAERQVEELNAVVVDQGRSIAALQKRLDLLTTRFLAVEEQVQPEIPVDRPPHW